MSSFDERKSAEESRFAMDAEMQFKVTARRNKLLGLYLADLFGLKDAEAEAYAKSVVLSDMEEAGDEDLLRKVRADLSAHNVSLSDTVLREKMAELLPVAREQILKSI